MKTRRCPVDAACAPLKGWETFLGHIYREHTEGSEEERLAAVQAHLERGPRDREAEDYYAEESDRLRLGTEG